MTLHPQRKSFPTIYFATDTRSSVANELPVDWMRRQYLRFLTRSANQPAVSKAMHRHTAGSAPFSSPLLSSQPAKRGMGEKSKMEILERQAINQSGRAI